MCRLAFSTFRESTLQRRRTDQANTLQDHHLVAMGREALDERIERTASSAAADLTWRARAPEEATRRGLLPRLFSVVLRGSGGNRRHHRRRRSLFHRRCGAGRAGQGVVFLETALFVFAARTAWAGLVAPRSSNRPSSHRTSVHPPTLVSLPYQKAYSYSIIESLVRDG